MNRRIVKKRIEIGRLDRGGPLFLWVQAYVGGAPTLGCRVVARLWPRPFIHWPSVKLAWHEWRNGIY